MQRHASDPSYIMTWSTTLIWVVLMHLRFRTLENCRFLVRANLSKPARSQWRHQHPTKPLSEGLPRPIRAPRSALRDLGDRFLLFMSAVSCISSVLPSSCSSDPVGRCGGVQVAPVFQLSYSPSDPSSAVDASILSSLLFYTTLIPHSICQT